MSKILQAVRVEILSVSSTTAARLRLGQQEAAKVWTTCRDAQRDAFKNKTPWPNQNALHALTKGKFALHSQSVQQINRAFLGARDTIKQLRAAGSKRARYPWRDKTFYPLMWPAQAMCVRDDTIVLPMGRHNASIVLKRPDWLTEPCACKIVWNRTHYELHATIERPAEQSPGDNVATIDLGQIHQCAVTTGDGYGLIVSGRGIRSEKQRATKMHGSIAALQSRCKKYSRRWKKLQRARHTYALRSERRIRDMRHKGTRQAIDFCVARGVGGLFIGDPDGVRKRPSGRKHNQRMSQWEYGKDIDYLRHKAERAGMSSFIGSERGTSSRCPECGHKHKPRGRNWVCSSCGFVGHRDLVGSVNMHEDAFGKKPTFPASKDVTYLRPGTATMRVLARRSNRPDTGRRASENPPASLNRDISSQPTAKSAVRRKTRAGGNVDLSEARSL